MYTYFLILSFSVFLSVQQNKIKNEGLNYLLLLVEAVFLILSKNNSDYSTYLMIYNGNIELPVEKGMIIVASFLKSIGLESYTYFLILVMLFVAFVFLKWGQIIPYINHVLFFYSLMIMYYDCIQIRNTIATFLLLYALYLGLYGKRMKMLVVCAVAILFHRLAVVLLLILIYVTFFKPRKDYMISKIEIGVHIFIGLLISIFGRKILMFLASKSILFVKIYDYLSIDTGYDSLIIWAGTTGGMMIILWYFGVKNSLLSDNHQISQIRKQAINYLFRFSLFSISCSGFLLFLNEFNRIYRLFDIMLFMIFAIIENEMSWKNKRLTFLIFSLVNIAFMMVALSRGVNLDTFFIK